MTVPTVDCEMHPATVASLFSSLFVEHHHGTLVPTFVVCPQIIDLDRRRLNQPHTTLTTISHLMVHMTKVPNCLQPLICQT